MNGMENLEVFDAEQRMIEMTTKEQLVSVICDQQKELKRYKALFEREQETSERYRNAYESLSKLDWMVVNEKSRNLWKDAKLTPPIDSSLKWVCTQGGKEVAAFYDNEEDGWWTERHEKVNALVWQHLPHFLKKNKEEENERDN